MCSNEAGIVDALENGVVAPPKHDETLSHEEDPFLDVLSDSGLTHGLYIFLYIVLVHQLHITSVMQGMFGTSLSWHKTFAMRMRIIPCGIIEA